MKFLLAILFTFATLTSVAQVNFVKNPSFEEFSVCPTDADQITYAKNWSNAIDTIFHASSNWQSEYYNTCAIGNIYTGAPYNINFYQNVRSGNGMVGSTMYFDKTPPSTVYPNYREYIQGRLITLLKPATIYCVSFFLNLAEKSGYSHNKIGAYLDNGGINKLSISKATEITSLMPQIFTNTKINDTLNWIKIEGSFSATGNENYITIGNFFKNADVDTEPFWGSQYSYYLIDDVSVVAIDAKANAGVDRWVELGKSTAIGPVEDSTARGMDCKWYHKGKLIDSGNVITVNASSIKYAVDTYVVVQNVCGNITRDTMLLRTVGLGLSQALSNGEGVSVSPNPSSGKFVITCHPSNGGAGGGIKVYDLFGRIVHQEALHFTNKEANLNLNLQSGTYILELKDEAGNVQRERLIIE